MWVSRDKRFSEDVAIHLSKPAYNKQLQQYDSSGEQLSLLYETFIRRYHVKLKPGERKPVKLVEA